MAKSKWPMVQGRFAEIEVWLRDGLTEKQIIKNLGIGKTTWEGYKNKHEELMELLKKGRASQVQEVENALFKAATGYYYTVQEAVKIKNGDGSESVETVTLKKFKPPETGAMCFFLKNKDKGNWADNPQMVDAKREELEIRRKESEFRSW